MICNVDIYIDENSLSKINDKKIFLDFILDFLSFSAAFKVDISGVKIDFKIWGHDNLESQCLCINNSHITFLEAVNSLLPTDTKRLFKKIFYDKSCQIWCDERVHSEEIYYELLGDCVTDDTSAECAEVTLLGEKKPLFFVNPHCITGKYIVVKKYLENDDSVNIQVELADFQIDAKNWVDEKYNLSDFCYDITSTNPPTDKQSYLYDESRFSKTVHINQGRMVYFCNLNRTYHVIDNLHYGSKAHVEVWHRFGDHLCENDLAGKKIHIGRPKKNNPSWLA